jgi:hypothetical protein
VAIEALAGVDFAAWREPDPDMESREFLEAWLRYQRHEFLRKLRDLEPDQLAAWAGAPAPKRPIVATTSMTTSRLPILCT